MAKAINANSQTGTPLLLPILIEPPVNPEWTELLVVPPDVAGPEEPPVSPPPPVNEVNAPNIINSFSYIECKE
ncbi:TPA: hypothetical protein ACMDR6_004016 [Vibrio parahaemolyticus]